MAQWYLQPDDPLPAVPLASGSEVVLGRSRALQIDCTLVSRAAVSVEASSNSVVVKALKKAYVQRAGSTLEALAPGSAIQLSNGDKIFLAVVGEQPKFGFMLRKKVLPSSSSPKAAPPQAAPKASLSKRKGKPLESPPKHTQQELPAAPKVPPVQSPARPRFLAGFSLVFWETSHVSRMVARAREAGAEVLPEFQAGRTTHIISPRDAPALPEEDEWNLREKLRNICPQGTQQLPEGVLFVTPEFVSECLAVGARVPEQGFAVDARWLASLIRGEAEGGEGEVLAALPSSLHSAGAVSPEGSPAREGQLAGSLMATPGKPPGNPAAPNPSQLPRPEAPTPLPPGPGAIASPSGETLAFTGGASGVAWGAGGHWTEPYTEAGAKDTLRKLELHWHRLDLKPGGETEWGNRQGAAAAQDSVPLEERGAQAGGPGERRNRVCSHVACSGVDFCIVAQLQLVRSHYRDRVDQFRIKAMERSIAIVSRHDRPLREAADVDALAVGARSKEKLKEILETGALQRNLWMAQDERHKAVEMFLGVWGAGESKCETWWEQGCRTLEDVRARPDLTEQQAEEKEMQRELLNGL